MTLSQIYIPQIRSTGHLAKYPTLEQIVQAVEGDGFNFYRSSYHSLLLNSGFDEEEHAPLLARLSAAYNFAHMAHLGQERLSGEPYISHPRAVAKKSLNVYLTARKGSPDYYENAAEVAVLSWIHDGPEDNPYATVELAADIFGQVTADRLSGLQKSHWVSRNGIFQSVKLPSEQIDDKVNAYDELVALVSLSDRWHNLVTIRYLPEPNQLKKLQSTQSRYMPLALRHNYPIFTNEFQKLLWQHPLYNLPHATPSISLPAGAD